MRLLFHDHLLAGWESLPYLLSLKAARGEQNHKISWGWERHKLSNEKAGMLPYTRKGRHHISKWCKVLQASQIPTAITCCGKAKQIQP